MQRIRRVQVIPLVRKLSRAFHGSTYRIVSRNTLYVRVESEDGIVGEAFGGDEDIHQEKVVELANEIFAPQLVGKEILPIEKLWQSMFTRRGLPFHNRSIHTLDLINHAILMQAIAIIDMGIWDLAGKILGKPLWQLLGGFQERIPVIGIGGYPSETEDAQKLKDEVESFLAGGLCGIKLKVGASAVKDDLKRVEALRSHFGSELVLSCDANQAWTLKQALEFAKQARSYDLKWLEEPIQWDNQLMGLKRLREKTDIPVVAGQGEISSSGCRDLILNDCVDILNFDATIGGGITEWRKTATFAQLMGVSMGHHEEPQVAIHLLASIPHSTYVEIFPDPERDPLWHELVLEKPRISDGYMYAPQGPGLGLDYDGDLIERYAFDYGHQQVAG